MKKKQERLKIRITRKTSIDGQDVHPEQIVEVSVSTAKLLIGIKKAVRYRKDGEESKPDIKTYSLEDLDAMSMGDLREIGDAYGVRDNKKDDLVLKIVEAQEANES